MGNFVQDTEYDVHMYAKSEYSRIYRFLQLNPSTLSCNNFTEGNIAQK
jgi:hypothetical protein